MWSIGWRRAALVSSVLVAVTGCSAILPDVGPERPSVASDAAVVRPESGVPEGGTADGSVDAGVDATVVARTWTVRVGPNGDHVFDPPNLAIRVGDTVRWVWETSNHTVTSGVGGVADDRFCSPSGTRCAASATSDKGATFDVTFTMPGTYPYYCRPHRSAGMIGSVLVE